MCNFESITIRQLKQVLNSLETKGNPSEVNIKFIKSLNIKKISQIVSILKVKAV